MAMIGSGAGLNVLLDIANCFAPKESYKRIFFVSFKLLGSENFNLIKQLLVGGIYWLC